MKRAVLHRPPFFPLKAFITKNFPGYEAHCLTFFVRIGRLIVVERQLIDISKKILNEQ